MSKDDSNYNEELYPGVPIIGKLFDKLSPIMDRMLCEKTYQKITHLLVLVAHLVLLSTAVAALLIGLFGFSKLGYTEYLFFGVGYFIFMPCIQYLSNKFIQTNLHLLKSTPSQISSNLFPNLIGTVSLFAGVILAVYYTNSAFTLAEYSQLRFAIYALLFGWAIAIFARNISLVFVNIKPETSAGGEALGITSVIIRLIYRIVPMVFSLAVLYAAITTYIDIFANYRSENFQIFINLFFAENAVMLVYLATLPIIAYLLFTAAYLIIDLCRSLLSIRKDS